MFHIGKSQNTVCIRRCITSDFSLTIILQMLLFNASLINITQSMLRLERARLLESQSVHDEWIGLKMNTVPYVFAEGNAKLFAKQAFSNEEVYQFFRETECETTCYAKNEWDQETSTDYLNYTCTKRIDELNIDIYGLHNNVLCNYFTFDKQCRETDRKFTLNDEDAYKSAAQIVTQSKWTWLYLATHDEYLNEDFTALRSFDEIYNYLTKKLNPSWFESLGWIDVHSTAAGLELAKAMAVDICDSRCSLHTASSSGEVHVDDSCVHALKGKLYPIVHDYMLCPYVKSYVDCTTPIKNGLDGTTAVIILAVSVVVLIAIILTCVHCCRKRKSTRNSSEDSSSSSSSRKEEQI